MKRTLHTIFLLLFAATITLAQQAEKTLVKSFDLKGNQVVSLELEGLVEMKSWNNSFLRIQMNIKLKNGSEALLKSLATNGRYNLRSTVEAGMFRIFAPDMRKEVKVGGKQLEEIIFFTVFTPENVLVRLPRQLSTGADDLKTAESL